jgi:hypothetical protein
MLTVQSNLKIHNLETLSKVIIKADIINFGLNKVGGGFTAMIADKIINKLTLNKNKTIVVINDITLQMTEKLLEAGYKNIYLAFGKWNKDGNVSSDTTVYNIMKAFVKHNIKEDLNVISLKEIFNMKIDGFIVNPPYGSIGANITKNIIDRVDFEEYVNLLPANDYKRNKTKDLFKYQSEMEAINNGFEDAAVTTHVARIHKNKVNNMTLDEFERSQYIDPQLNKYFEENSKRTHYAIDGATQALIFTSGLTNKTTTIIDHRFIPHKHLAYSKNTDEYKWNVLKSITLEDLKQEFEGKVTFRKGTALNKYVITFNTETENTNINHFIYSKDGFRFMSKIATAVNVDSTVDINKILPKVDWTRSWTVEEVLKEYGYTPEEITEAMNDLRRFKGMED